MQAEVYDPRMTLEGVRDLLGATVLSAGDLSKKVDAVLAADLMSDVLTIGGPGMLLLTGLASVQTVRTAAIADLVGVVLIGGKKPSEEVISLARAENVCLLGTRMSMFQAAGLLYRAIPAREERCGAR